MLCSEIPVKRAYVTSASILHISLIIREFPSELAIAVTRAIGTSARLVGSIEGLTNRNLLHRRRLMTYDPLALRLLLKSFRLRDLACATSSLLPRAIGGIHAPALSRTHARTLISRLT